MKNLLSIIAFVFVITLSSQSINAQSLSQDKDKVEVVAKSQVVDLAKKLNLNDDQQRTLYRAFVSREVNYRKLVNGQDPKNEKVIANKNKIDVTFDSSMKKTLTEKQYSEWKKSNK